MDFRLKNKTLAVICLSAAVILLGCGQEAAIETPGPAEITPAAKEAVGESAGVEVVYEPWYALGPFYDITFEEVIGPENGPDLARVYEQDTPFEYKWRLHPEWKDGVGLELRLPVKSCMYFYRVAKASEAGAAEFTVGTGDGLQVWVNRQEVFKRFEVGNPNTELVTAKLRKGGNTILLKVYNEDSASELFFEK